MSDDQTMLELISEITEFNDMHEFMQDEQLDRAMEIVIKLIAKPDVPVSYATRLIVELQALSTKFAMLAAYYATIAKDRAGTANNNKKNIYYSTKEAIDKLVDSLKYAAKFG
jgi:lipopolysaccharide biosynthesis protein